MTKFMNNFYIKNKKGVTLVELVLGVVILSLFAIGVLASLSAASTKIAQSSKDAATHSEATQMMDAVISIVSNGDYSPENLGAGVTAESAVLGVLDDIYSLDGVDLFNMEPKTYADGALRGWKITLKYKGTTVTGYSSNTKGVFDVKNESDS